LDKISVTVDDIMEGERSQHF